MRKHKLIELQTIIDERIGSLTEEVEIATNVKLNPLYIADRRDEIEFLRWTATVINSILTRDIDRKQVQLGTTKMRLQLSDIIEFENILHNRIEELNLKLKESNNLRESDILINEIDTLESVQGRLADLKYGDKARAIEIAEANNDFRQSIRLRKQLNKIQDLEDEISAQCSNTKLRWTS
jgi:transcriptional regulator of heat shock response